MRILITNDDGIHAPGLAVLERIAKNLTDDVWVVGPETDQSGVSHSLSLNDPLRLRKISDKHYAVKGTPTDCVIMGVKHVLKDGKPDLVLSGVNSGQNVAEDVTYSGTIAAAIEGTFLGVPSIALSQGYGPEGRETMHWECAETLAPETIRKVMAAGIEKGSLVNLNFPNCPPEEVRGVAVTAQGFRDQQLLRLDARVDGRGREYFWIAFQRGPHTPANGTDLWARAERKISITPLRLDLTDEPMMTRYARAFA